MQGADYSPKISLIARQNSLIADCRPDE